MIAVLARLVRRLAAERAAHRRQQERVNQWLSGLAKQDDDIRRYGPHILFMPPEDICDCKHPKKSHVDATHAFGPGCLCGFHRCPCRKSYAGHVTQMDMP